MVILIVSQQLHFFKELFLFIYITIFRAFHFFVVLLKFVLAYSEVLMHDFDNIFAASFGIPCEVATIVYASSIPITILKKFM
jgi:hypothetical protein